MKTGDTFTKEGYQIWWQDRDGKFYALPTIHKTIEDARKVVRDIYKPFCGGLAQIQRDDTPEPRRFISKVVRHFEVLEEIKPA